MIGGSVCPLRRSKIPRRGPVNDAGAFIGLRVELKGGVPGAGQTPGIASVSLISGVA